MTLDILLFRDPVGANLIRESQRRRCKDPKIVDYALEADRIWRVKQHILESSNKGVNDCSRAVKAKMQAKEGEGETDELPAEIKEAVQDGSLAPEQINKLCVKQVRALSKYISSQTDAFKRAAEEAEIARDNLVHSVGNIVHESVPVGFDEDESNTTVSTYGDCTKKAALNHVDIMGKLGVMDTSKNVSAMSGGRAYVLKGPLVQLQMALSMYAMNFMTSKGFLPFYPPFFLDYG
jgi:seryl-tRNA synthetase